MLWWVMLWWVMLWSVVLWSVMLWSVMLWSVMLWTRSYEIYYLALYYYKVYYYQVSRSVLIAVCWYLAAQSGPVSWLVSSEHLLSLLSAQFNRMIFSNYQCYWDTLTQREEYQGQRGSVERLDSWTMFTCLVFTANYQFIAHRNHWVGGRDYLYLLSVIET